MDSMKSVVATITEAMLLIGSLAIFVVLVGNVIPKLFLRIDCSYEKGLGRGLNKYKYPGGRAVLYEPHPSVRKYVNKYVLFVSEGYKYLQCQVDKGVKTLEYNVVMLNNKNRVIDVLSVRSKIGDEAKTKEILLHPKTSYVALGIEAVNGLGVKGKVECGYKLSRIIAYFAAVALATAFELALVSEMLGSLFSAFDLEYSISAEFSSYWVWALFVAAFAVVLVLVNSAGKGIKVMMNGKK